jgi:hypothetical protein
MRDRMNRYRVQKRFDLPVGNYSSKKKAAINLVKSMVTGVDQSPVVIPTTFG